MRARAGGAATDPPAAKLSQTGCMSRLGTKAGYPRLQWLVPGGAF
jgi:hypothetical protein